MRITVTLDPDTAELLRTAMLERGASFNAVLNDSVRKGLAPARRARKRRFAQQTYALGASDHFWWDKALAIAHAMEDGEIVRKMALRS